MLGAVAGRGEEGAAAAEKLEVKIAIEVVWNNFITKPEQLIEYVDSFKSEWVGAYFDCSNMIKYGVAVRGLDPQARQADAEVRLQGVQQGEGEAERTRGGFDVGSARATRTGRRC